MTTPRNITIREAIALDAADIADLSERAFATLRSIYRPNSEAIARKVISDQELTQLVAEIEERIVGTVQFTIDKNHVHLSSLAVHPDFQRQGIASRLIEWLAAHSRTLGRKTIALDTIKETGNVPRFEKLGFRVIYENIATWCTSNKYPELHDIRMERDVV